ncbi:uncharacterized protein LOC143014522 isoform X3 [Genypterus blacodes]|uniref:uncharacterized protein LOC143014522 isoform X3 n=1 Tax=Genypterus blacodes TaxID=154954 RepID=UPI003F75B931
MAELNCSDDFVLAMSLKTLLLYLLQMTVRRQAVILLYFILICVEFCIASSTVVHRAKYNNCLHLTKSTRAHVQQLLWTYKEQQLGNKHFEIRSGQLRGLPLLSTDFYSWLKLTDWDRLHAAFWDLNAYRNMLEKKRKQLENEAKETAHTTNTLPQSIEYIELDLRDLMRKVRSQMNHVKNSGTRPTMPTVHSSISPHLKSQMMWDSQVEGYIILRDLNLYLTKLARDFLLLASKTHS